MRHHLALDVPMQSRNLCPVHDVKNPCTAHGGLNSSSMWSEMSVCQLENFLGKVSSNNPTELQTVVFTCLNKMVKVFPHGKTPKNSTIFTLLRQYLADSDGPAFHASTMLLA